MRASRYRSQAGARSRLSVTDAWRNLDAVAIEFDFVNPFAPRWRMHVLDRMAGLDEARNRPAARFVRNAGQERAANGGGYATQQTCRFKYLGARLFQHSPKR